jgi:hypothetical protein
MLGLELLVLSDSERYSLPDKSLDQYEPGMVILIGPRHSGYRCEPSRRGLANPSCERRHNFDPMEVIV